jgi:hypothetical protein
MRLTLFARAVLATFIADALIAYATYEYLF